MSPFLLLLLLLLLVRYSEFLLREDNEDVIPFAVAVGDAQQLVNYFHSNGQYQEAMVTSQAACEDAFHRPHLLKKPKSSYSSDGVSETDLGNYNRYASCWCARIWTSAGVKRLGQLQNVLLVLV